MILFGFSARRVMVMCFVTLLVACESLEGNRVAVPGAQVSLFVPANWQSEVFTTPKGGEVWLEASPRDVPEVKLKLLCSMHPPSDPGDVRTSELDRAVAQTLRDVKALERKGQVRVANAETVQMERDGVQGYRLTHQIEVGGKAGLTLTQRTEHWPVQGRIVSLLALGPKDKVAGVAAELERITASMRSLVPEAAPRLLPPPGVTSRPLQAFVRLLKPPD